MQQRGDEHGAVDTGNKERGDFPADGKKGDRQDDKGDTVGDELRGRERDPNGFMGLPNIFWALVCVLVAMLVYVACIPFILTIAKRRPRQYQN